MPRLTSYDGGVVATPQRVIRPETVDELTTILTQPDKFPGPVRAMGSFHSLTPCAASPGTMVDMRGLKNVVTIDAQKRTLTAQAGLQLVEAAAALRRQRLQMMLNPEIGNMTLGSAACCHSKDSLDGVEFGQVSSYVTKIKWVNPAGGLEEASEDTNAPLLSLVRASHGLCGIVYEVTLKVTPLEMVRWDYQCVNLDDLTQQQVAECLASNESAVFWTIGRSVVIKTRNRTTALRHAWLAPIRRLSWSHLASFASRAVTRYTPRPLLSVAQDGGFALNLWLYRVLSGIGGLSLHNPDKIVDYARTPASARYAFTFWAFPVEDWVKNLKAYVEFSEDHGRRHGFRCNMQLGSYFIRCDTSSLLSYSYDGDIISIDPIHAPCDRDRHAWNYFLERFNEWAHARGGIPLLNQSPHMKRAHLVAAYGDRWKTFSDWVRLVDPDGRMLNPFFRELLWQPTDEPAQS